MGLLTLIAFRNDAYGSFEKYKNELVEGILGALRGDQLRQGRNYFPLGSECNPVVIQRTRHADDTTLYLFSGNTVIDLCSIEEKDEWAINASISEMTYQMKRLKELKKSIKEKK